MAKESYTQGGQVTLEDLERHKLRLLQKISEDRKPCRNTLGSNCSSYFLSDQSIHLKIFLFIYQINR